MGLGTGTSQPDIKINTAIGNSAWADTFFIPGTLETNATTWKLISQLPEIQELPHRQLTGLSKVKLASTSTLDNATGIGARAVIVTGLGEFYNIQEEVVIMNGQAEVETLLEYQSVFELLILQIGSNIDIETGDLAPVGDIYCGTGIFTLGIPDNPIVGIKASENNLNSQDCIFQVPDAYFLAIKGWFATTNIDRLKNTSSDIQLCLNFFGQPENQWYKSLQHTFIDTYNYVPESLVILPPKTEIQFRGKMDTLESTRLKLEVSVELIDIRRINFG